MHHLINHPRRGVRRVAVAAGAATMLIMGRVLPAQAPPPVSASVSVGATVLLPLSLTITAGMDFGKLVAGAGKSIQPTAIGAGRAEIVGSGGAPVIVAITMPASLTLSGGTATLPAMAWSYAMGPDAALAAAPGVAFDAGIERDVPVTLPGTGTARLYVGIGATVQAAPDQAPGVYAGTGRISVFYADL